MDEYIDLDNTYLSQEDLQKYDAYNKAVGYMAQEDIMKNAGPAYDWSKKTGLPPEIYDRENDYQKRQDLISALGQDDPTLKYLAQDKFGYQVSSKDLEDMLAMSYIVSSKGLADVSHDEEDGLFDKISQAGVYELGVTRELSTLYYKKYKDNSATEEDLARLEALEYMVNSGQLKYPESSGPIEYLAIGAATAVTGITDTVGKWLTDEKVLATIVASGGVGGAVGSVVPVVGTAAGTLKGMAIAGQATFKSKMAEQSYIMESGAAYADMVRDAKKKGEPLDLEAADAVSTIVGATNAGLDVMGVSVVSDLFLAPFKKMGKKQALDLLKQATKNPTFRSALISAAKMVLGGVSVEVGTEVLQEGVTIVGSQKVRKMSGVDIAYSEELLTKGNFDRILEVAGKSLQSTLGMSLAPSAVRVYTDSVAGKAAQKDVANLVEVKKMLDTLETAKTSVEKTKEFAGALGFSRNMELTPEIARALSVANPRAMEVIGLTTDNIAYSEKTGTSLKVNVADAMAKLDEASFKQVVEVAVRPELGVSAVDALAKGETDINEVYDIYDSISREQVAIEENLATLTRSLVDGGASLEDATAYAEVVRGMASKLTGQSQVDFINRIVNMEPAEATTTSTTTVDETVLAAVESDTNVASDGFAVPAGYFGTDFNTIYAQMSPATKSIMPRAMMEAAFKENPARVSKMLYEDLRKVQSADSFKAYQKTQSRRVSEAYVDMTKRQLAKTGLTFGVVTDAKELGKYYNKITSTRNPDGTLTRVVTEIKEDATGRRGLEKVTEVSADTAYGPAVFSTKTENIKLGGFTTRQGADAHKVFLVDTGNLTALIHEHAHLLYSIILDNPELREFIKSEIVKEKEIWASINTNPMYRNLSLELRIEEAFVTMLGIYAAEMVNTYGVKNASQVIKDILRNVYAKIRSFLGLPAMPEEIYSLDQVIRMTSYDLLKGEKIFDLVTKKAIIGASFAESATNKNYLGALLAGSGVSSTLFHDYGNGYNGEKAYAGAVSEPKKTIRVLAQEMAKPDSKLKEVNTYILNLSVEDSFDSEDFVEGKNLIGMLELDPKDLAKVAKYLKSKGLEFVYLEEAGVVQLMPKYADGSVQSAKFNLAQFEKVVRSMNKKLKLDLPLSTMQVDMETVTEENADEQFRKSNKEAESSKPSEGQSVPKENAGYVSSASTDEAHTEPIFVANPKYILSLMKDQDISTLTRMTAELFLKEIKSEVNNGVAAPETVESWGRIKEAFKIELDSSEITKETFDKFAVSFEKYLLDGRTDRVVMTEPMEQFRTWLGAHYKGNADVLSDAGMDYRLRDVFDNLIATERQIDDAWIANNVFGVNDKGFELLGITVEERAMLKGILANARAKAKQELMTARSKDRSKNILSWTKTITDQVSEEPVYKTMEYLKQNGGFSFESVEAAFGKDAARALGKKAQYLVGGTRDIEVMARLSGYETAQEMYADIMAAEDKETRIKNILRQMISEYDASFDANAYLLSQPEIAQYFDTMMSLSKFATDRVTSKARQAKFKAEVDAHFRTLTTKEAIDVKQVMRDMKAAAKEQLKAIKNSDPQAMLESYGRLRFQTELLKVVRNFEKETRQAFKMFDRVNRAEKGSIDGKYYMAVQAVMASVGLKISKKIKPEGELPAISDFFKEDPTGMGVVASFPAWLTRDRSLNDALDATENIDVLKIDDFRHLVNFVKFMVGKGRDEVKLDIAEVNRTAEEVANIATETVKGLKKQVWKVKETNVLYGATHALRRFISSKTFFRDILQHMDGLIYAKGQKGILERAVYDPLSQASTEIIAKNREVTNRLHAAMRDLKDFYRRMPKTINDTGVKVPEILAREGRAWTAERIIMIALNMGCADNLNAIKESYGLTDNDLQALVSKLSNVEWMAIQEIWDSFDATWEDVAATHEKINHFRPNKVMAQAIEVKTSGGFNIVVEGGYFPLMYDKTLAPELGDTEDFFKTMQHTFGSPNVSTASVKSRSGVTKYPPLLSMTVIPRYFDSAINYAVMADPIRKADKILNNRALYNATKDALGVEKADHLRDDLREMARRSQDSLTPIDGIFNKLINKATVYALAMSPSVALKQPISVSAIGSMKGGYRILWNGAKRLMKDGMGAVKFSRETSEYMRNRHRFFEFTTQEQVSEFDITKRDKAFGFIPARVANFLNFALINTGDMIASTPIWLGIYDAGVANGLTKEEASKAADEGVIDTQSSRRVIDLSPIQRRKGVSRLFTMFMTAMLNIENRRSKSTLAFREGTMSFQEYTFNTFNEWFVPAAGTFIMQSLLWGETPDDEEELEDLAWELFQYRLGGLPFVRDLGAVTEAVVRDENVTRKNLRIPALMGVDLTFKFLGGLIKDLNDEDESEEINQKNRDKAVMAFADLVSFWGGLPVSKVYRNLDEGIRQFEETENASWFNILVPNPDERGKK